MAEHSSNVILSLKILTNLLKEQLGLTTPQIIDRLIREGFIESREEKEEKKVRNILRNLERHGLIKNREGQKPLRWHITKKGIEALGFSGEFTKSMLILLSFLPREFIKLEAFNIVSNIVNRNIPFLDKKQVEIIRKSFFFEPPFNLKFSTPDEETLSVIVQAILNRHAIYLTSKIWKPPKQVIFYPINLFYYNGTLYVGGLNKNRKYRTYKVSTIKAYPCKGKKLRSGDRFRGKAWSFEDEKPFVFGVEVSARDAKGLELNEGKEEEVVGIFSTQFFSKKTDKGMFIVYLVGYPSYRFCTAFLTREFLSIIPPSEEILEKARSKELKKKLNISYSLKENKKNFQKFKSLLSKIISSKYKLVRDVKDGKHS